jgi:pimeloyl-ACP methyl ester carboxylesterase
LNKTFRYLSSEISYLDKGSGGLVLLLHGFGEDHGIWDPQVDELKDQFRLIAVDLPGSGKSEPIEDMSLEGLAASIRHLIYFLASENSIESEPITVIGHSMGGYVALALVEKYPRLFSGLGLFHSTSFADSVEKKKNRIKSIDFIAEHGANAFLRQAIPNLFSNLFKSENPEAVDSLIRRNDGFTAKTLISYYEAMMNRPERIAVLRNFRGPVLFVIGMLDPAIPFEDSLKQCHLPDLAHIHIFENIAHMGMLENPKASYLAIRDFLQDIYHYRKK